MYFVKGELRKKTIFPNFGYLTPQPRRLKRKESLLQIFYDMQSILYHWISPRSHVYCRHGGGMQMVTKQTPAQECLF